MRLWEVNFEVHRKLPSLPFPGVLVDEVQTLPSYRLEGKKRKEQTGCQFVYTLEGEGRYWGRGIEYKLPPGTGFLQKHDDPATAYYYPPEGKTTWRFIWMSFYSKTSDKIVMELIDRYGYIYKLPKNRGIIKKLESYRNLRDIVQVLSPLAGAGLVMEILTALGESIEAKRESDPQSDLIKTAQRFIMENLDKNIGVAEIASLLNVSREHLSRVFKEQTGTTPLDYMHRKKIRHACHLLRNTTLSCKEIAQRTGYENANSFSRVFKSFLHFSPAEVRKNNYYNEFL